MIAILYSAKTRLTPEHQLLHNFTLDKPHNIWIRIEYHEYNKKSLSDSLDLANPMEGEIVLNTIRV